jgi:hypothetical protein
MKHCVLSYLVGFFFGLVTSTLFTGTEGTLFRASVTELHVSIGGLFFSSDSTSFRTSSDLLDGKEGALVLDSGSNFSGLFKEKLIDHPVPEPINL